MNQPCNSSPDGNLAPDNIDVIIIGAGPSGSVAAALLHSHGHRVHIIERQHFPRFSIGESLLPQCMVFLEEADLLSTVKTAATQDHFQFKNGATFFHRNHFSYFDFEEKFSSGPGTTFQVQRGPFDHALIQEVERRGVTVAWGHEITAIEFERDQPILGIRDEAEKHYQLRARFVLDASGFGRVLPRLLNLEKPSNFPSRTSLFTHIEDHIAPTAFDRNKIRITVDHAQQDTWYWLIPFANGRCSIGVVGHPEYFEQFITADSDISSKLQRILLQEPTLQPLLQHAVFDTPARSISSYSCDVESLWGPGFALLGNAGEFLDPVFSSGVTIAMKSASLAAGVLNQQLRGKTVDWERDYAQALRSGVDTFRSFVTAWYDGRFQDIIFSEQQSPRVREMISSILAGYAWDQSNPYVKESERRINTLAELCKR